MIIQYLGAGGAKLLEQRAQAVPATIRREAQTLDVPSSKNLNPNRKTREPLLATPF